MSVLEIPRFYFRGQIAWDPVTTNNNPPAPPSQNPSATYDEADCDATFNQSDVGAANVAAFRQAAIDDPGNWNPHGSYRSPFFETAISGVDTGSGLNLTDPFVAAPIAFTGMLVDCEPYGTFTSQLFFDDMSFGIAGGCRIYGKRVTRLIARYINFSANPSNNMVAGVASVLWQTCFAKDRGLEIDAFDSLALQALHGSMDDDDVLGVMVRFNTYRTVYYDDATLANGTQASVDAAAALQAKLNRGGFQPNPARSLLVGTVGLWRKGEALSEPSERTLISTLRPIPGQPAPGQGGPVVGTAFARLSDAGITLDLSNTIPCANRATDKIPIGTLHITAADPPPAVAIEQVATIELGQYDRLAYEATSGIVEIPFPDAARRLTNMNLAISGPDGTKYLAEAPLRAIPGTPNCYVNQGATASVLVQVYERGVTAGAGIPVVISEMGSSQSTHLSAVTDASGQVTFPLAASVAQVTGLVFQPGPAPVLPVAFNQLRNTYMYLRVLPADENYAAMPPSWDNVHNFVLSNWEAMAPCMDNWLLLGNQQQVQGYAALIRKLTDPANFESFRFMPVTRDLSPGKRTLLYRFLDGGGDFQTLVTESAPIVPEPRGLDVQKLSRAMRGG